jgi:hypothetical protein
MVGSSSSGANVGPGLKNQPFVASLVWSYDHFVAQYEATMSIQKTIFFRDGLSEDEYARVGKEEIEDIKCEW